MPSPKTPVSSRCGYLRNRKRIHVHPISLLSKKTKTDNNQKSDLDDSAANDAELSNYSKDTSVESEFKLNASDSGFDDSQDIGKTDRDPQRKVKKNPF
ncbi:uncharacterized protein LOC108109850 [Drosophila eugracilis]|uniref:uncharacterized protein LOC108109850 n=1 Tax=Drosophila eugracilis TaxID=29029 RepID=UPI0007E6D612|nr:uncharacterized protein LOC108109850 [Drosophila eugracilis]